MSLASPVAIDGVAPGTYSKFPSGTATIAAGTLVDSHLIHSDPRARNATRHRTGSVTFADDILGVIASTTRLANTDASLGAPGVTYIGTATSWRGLESSENSNSSGDKYTISADHRTVSFEVNTSVIDEIRVVTRATSRLSTSITQTPDPVQAGNDITYTITVTNNGGYAVPDVFVTDDFPLTTLVSATSSG